MKKMIRWGGLAGFIAFTALLFIIGYFFIDNWAKKAIEAAGLAVNGAEVDIADVSLSLKPVGFDIRGIEIADAEKPTHNALQIGAAKLDIDLAQLFLGNVRINNLELSDVQHDVERSRVAKVQERNALTEAITGNTDKAKDAAKNKANELGAALPKPEAILEERTANTREAVTNAKTTLQESSNSVQSAFKEIPTEKDIQAYKQRIKQLEEAKVESVEDIKTVSEQIKSLGKELAADKQAISGAKQSIDTAVDNSKNAISEVAKAPNKDWQQLKQDYPLDKSTAIKAAELLLGEDFFQRLEQANYWYNKAKPWLEKLQSEDEGENEEPYEAARSQGAFVEFYHPDPTAELQLDRGLLQFEFDDWPWLLEITDLVSGSASAGKPLNLLLKRGEADTPGFTVEGEMKKQNNVSVDTFVLNGRGIDFSPQNAEVAGSKLSWTPATANINGEVIATDGQLGGEVVLEFPSNRFQVEENGDNSRYLQAVMAKVNSFTVNVKVGGKVKRPSFKVSSTLDNQISEALQSVVKEEYQQWLTGMQQKIRERGDTLKAPLDTSLNSLNKKKQEAEAKVERFEKEVEAEFEALKAKLANKQKQLEDKVEAEAKKQKNRLKDRLKKEAGSLTDKFKN